MKKLEEQSGTILVVRIGRLGDFLVSLPALAVLRKNNPGKTITLLTGLSSSAKVAQIAAHYSAGENLPWIQFCMPALVDKAVIAHAPGTWRGWSVLRRRLGPAKRFDAIYILNYYGEGWKGRTAKRVWLRTLGLRGPIHDLSTVEVAARPDSLSWQMWTPLQIVSQRSKATEPDETPPWRLKPPADTGKWPSQVRQMREQARPIVILAASATHDHKRWPEECFEKLIKRLIEELHVLILLVGSSTDRLIANKLNLPKEAESVFNLCGETNLAELAAVISESDLFVGNDGGTAHLAAALGLPCVTIMSGVHPPGVWDPAACGGAAVRLAHLDCVGCRAEFSCPRGDNRCVREITVQQVFTHCHTALQAKTNSHDS